MPENTDGYKHTDIQKISFLLVHTVLKLTEVRPEDESAIAPYLGLLPNLAGLVPEIFGQSQSNLLRNQGIKPILQIDNESKKRNYGKHQEIFSRFRRLSEH